jgi:hypothetical protein
MAPFLRMVSVLCLRHKSVTAENMGLLHSDDRPLAIANQTDLVAMAV